MEHVLGKSWESQPTSSNTGHCYSTPLPARSAYEAKLAGAVPFTASELLGAEITFGFKFHTVLGKFMQLSNWTRPDLLPATACVAQYQSSPGVEHFFEALHRMVLFLCTSTDRGLIYFQLPSTS